MCGMQWTPCRRDCKVRAKQQLSQVFELLHGILEGACSSPPKYSIFAEELARRLQKENLGLTLTMVDGTRVWLGMLGFVDDKCLLATT